MQQAPLKFNTENIFAGLPTCLTVFTFGSSSKANIPCSISTPYLTQSFLPTAAASSILPGEENTGAISSLSVAYRMEEQDMMNIPAFDLLF